MASDQPQSGVGSIVSMLLFVKFCAGSAQLSAALAKAGFHSPLILVGTSLIQKSQQLIFTCRLQKVEQWLLGFAVTYFEWGSTLRFP